jgi:hypothetical protein
MDCDHEGQTSTFLCVALHVMHRVTVTVNLINGSTSKTELRNFRSQDIPPFPFVADAPHPMSL